MYMYTTTLPFLKMDCVFPGAGLMHILGVGAVIFVVLFFNSKYLPLSVVTLIMLFMLKQQHCTLTKVRKVDSYFYHTYHHFNIPPKAYACMCNTPCLVQYLKLR